MLALTHTHTLSLSPQKQSTQKNLETRIENGFSYKLNDPLSYEFTNPFMDFLKLQEKANGQ
jgi:hypothetical protein